MVASAESEAERILDTIWTVIAGSRVIPIDPIQIANALGIEVFDSRLSDDISGAIVKKSGRPPMILLNESDHLHRKRFSCAHEIGHFVQKTDVPDQYEYVDLRDLRASTGTFAEEVYANGFAAALLMPGLEVNQAYERDRSDIALASHFQVSREAMLNRLKNVRPDV